MLRKPALDAETVYARIRDVRRGILPRGDGLNPTEFVQGFLRLGRVDYDERFLPT